MIARGSLDRRRWGAALAGVLVLIAGSARAGDGTDPAAGDKSAYSIFNPTPDAQLRGLCTDRPTKSTGACTVDAGRLQLETDLINASFMRDAGVTSNTYLFTNPTLKLGLTSRVDVEVNIAPVVRVANRDENAHTRSTVTGVGDLYLRAKINLLGDDGGDIALALVPYVKAPTARDGIGNGAWEGGVVAPVSFNLPDQFSLGFDPELDVLKNADDGGGHLNLANLVTVSRPVGGGVTASAELWMDANDDPAGRVLQYSFDVGAAWIPSAHPAVQFDGGVNFGLNRATPGVQAYLGFSRRF